MVVVMMVVVLVYAYRKTGLDELLSGDDPVPAHSKASPSPSHIHFKWGRFLTICSTTIPIGVQSGENGLHAVDELPSRDGHVEGGGQPRHPCPHKYCTSDLARKSVQNKNMEHFLVVQSD
jgi:hypothetical protein